MFADDASAEGRTDGGGRGGKGQWKGGGDNWCHTFVLRSRPFEAYYQVSPN